MKEIKDLNELEEMLNNNEEIVVKKENETIQVMTMKEYKEYEMVEALLSSEDDIKNGRVRDAKEVFAEWKEKYGF